MPADAANTRRKTHSPKQTATALPPRPGVFRPTSLKLPLSLKVQIDETARKAGISPHAFMLQTLATATEQASLREQFLRDAQDAQAEMKARGLGHELSTVQDYFARLADFRAGKDRKPRKPSPKTIA